MTDNLSTWEELKRPPGDALRPISFGALKGKSDIDPVWRMKAMTKHFGQCGIGWKYEIKRVWSEPAPDEQTYAFAEVWLYTWIKERDSWSAPIPGIGGNMLSQLAKGKVKDNDEGYKMAVTDAIGTAMKAIGVAADVYMGKFDGCRYREDEDEYVSGEDLSNMKSLVQKYADEKAFLKYVGAESLETIPQKSFNKAMAALNKKRVDASKREPGSEG